MRMIVQRELTIRIKWIVNQLYHFVREFVAQSRNYAPNVQFCQHVARPILKPTPIPYLV